MSILILIAVPTIAGIAKHCSEQKAGIPSSFSRRNSCNIAQLLESFIGMPTLVPPQEASLSKREAAFGRLSSGYYALLAPDERNVLDP